MNLRKFVVGAYAFFCLASPQVLGAITYQITPRDGDTAPWSLDGGSITTDGTIGDITPLNFESWELRFSSPAGETEISSTNGGALLIITTFTNIYQSGPPPSLIATEENLVANPSYEGFLNLYFATQDLFLPNFTGNAVAFSPSPFTRIRFAGGVVVAGQLIDNRVDSSTPFSPFAINGNVISGQTGNPNRSSFAYPPGPLIIGSVVSVPEPPCLLLFAVCFSYLLFHRQAAVLLRI